MNFNSRNRKKWKTKSFKEFEHDAIRDYHMRQDMLTKIRAQGLYCRTCNSDTHSDQSSKDCPFSLRNDLLPIPPNLSPYDNRHSLYGIDSLPSSVFICKQCKKRGHKNSNDPRCVQKRNNLGYFRFY